MKQKLFLCLLVLIFVFIYVNNRISYHVFNLDYVNSYKSKINNEQNINKITEELEKRLKDLDKQIDDIDKIIKQIVKYPYLPNPKPGDEKPQYIPNPKHGDAQYIPNPYNSVFDYYDDQQRILEQQQRIYDEIKKTESDSRSKKPENDFYFIDKE
jgi:hypothetical protein